MYDIVRKLNLVLLLRKFFNSKCYENYARSGNDKLGGDYTTRARWGLCLCNLNSGWEGRNNKCKSRLYVIVIL